MPKEIKDGDMKTFLLYLRGDDKIRICAGCPEYWVLDGTKEEMRPYRIMLKEN